MEIPMLGGGGDGPKSFQQEYDAYCKLSKKNVTTQPHTPHTHIPHGSLTAHIHSLRLSCPLVSL